MNEKPSVSVWGSFDVLHDGHHYFLNECAQLGELNVILVPDSVIIENKKREPIFSENERMSFLKRLPFVHKVYIDSYKQGLICLQKIKPNIFCFGPGQENRYRSELISKLKTEFNGIKILNITHRYHGISSSNLIETNSYEELKMIVENVIQKRIKSENE